jgi:hypothetical protein
MFPGSAVSMTLSNRHGIRAARPDPGRSFRHVFAQASRRNRGKLIRWHRRADSIPRESRFQIGARKRRVSPHSIMPSDPAKYRAFHPLSPVFCPGWRPSRVRRPSRPAPATDEPRPLSLYKVRNRPQRTRRPHLRFDAREARWRARAACCGATPPIAVSIGAIRKYRIETISCRQTSITIACYLCNTL